MANTRSSGTSLLLRFAAVAATLTAASPARAHPDPDSLYHHALARLREGSPESRREAVAEMEECVRIAPGRADLWLACGRLEQQVGDLANARRSFARADALAPDDPSAALELAATYRWDWIESLDSDSFQRSAALLARVTDAHPERPEAWLDVTALALVRGDARLAASAAVHAQNADTHGPLPVLALACAAYRLGKLPLADSLFDAARARMPAELAARLVDLAPVRGRAAPAAAADSAAAKFWSDVDPDLTTPESEVRLDYLARLGQAILLFRDGDGVHWDMRTEMLVRYGLPATIQHNRTTGSLQIYRMMETAGSSAEGPGAASSDRGPAIEFGYPFSEQVWSYPALGMRAVMWDKNLSGRYTLPTVVDHDPDPRPSPAALAANPDLVAVGGGRGVYRALPPGMHGRALSVSLARYPAERGTRVVAHLTTAGAPGDTLLGRWVVRDAGGAEVARAAAPLGVSVCDPTGARTVEFAADLPPGEFRAGFAVEDVHGGRGLATRPLHVEADRGGLAISDGVLICGDAATRIDDRSVRIEPRAGDDLGSRPALDAYFEIRGLAPGADGRSRFAVTWRVRRIDPTSGVLAAPTIEASREDSQPGGLRRQFLHVPIATLAAGRYHLEVEVRDLGTGAAVSGGLDFGTGRPDR